MSRCYLLCLKVDATFVNKEFLIPDVTAFRVPDGTYKIKRLFA